MGKDNKKLRHGAAQTFLEYTLLIAVFLSLMVAMVPMIRRAGEGMVKAVADQVGSQRNAEDLGGKWGHLINSESYSQVDGDKDVQERLYTTTYIYNDESVVATSKVLSNEGFTEEHDYPHGYTVD